MIAPTYGYPYTRPSAWSDLRGWLHVQVVCWFAFVLVVGFAALVYGGLFLAIRWALA